MIVVFGWRRMSAFMSSRYAGLLVSAANGTSMSSWMIATSPISPASAKHAVERRIEQARRAGAHLVRDEFLVDRELADSREHAGEGPQHSPNLIGGVHVARIEPGDHRVEPRLFGGRERPILHRDVRVDERVVVERRVGVEVVRRRVITGDRVEPLLLERNPEHRHATDAVPEQREELLQRRTALDVVREVEV